MAIVRMEMLNMVGLMDDVDEIARYLVRSSSVHMVNASTEIQNNNFSVFQMKDNVDAMMDFNYIKQYTSKKDLEGTEEKLRSLSDILDIKNKVYDSHFDGQYDFQKDMEAINDLYEKIKDKNEAYQSLCKDLEELKELEIYLNCLRYLNFNLNEVLDMKFIRVRFGKLSKYDMDKLKKNYENIPAVVLKLDSDASSVTIAAFTPVSMENEANRALQSLNFHEFKTRFRFAGKPVEWLQAVQTKKGEILQQIKNLRRELQDFKKKHTKEIQTYYSRLMLEYKVEELKANMVCTEQFFYLLAWVPTTKKEKLSKFMEKYDERVIMVYRTDDELKGVLNPPTYLKNSRILRPFESMLKMYGVPAYNEVDPTPFMGLSYLLLFGAMFGDIGQGFVLFLAGLFLKKKKSRPNLGGILSSLGISSMVFGLLYGSVFGFEDVIKGTIIKPIKPMENIEFMLIAAIVLGIFLLSIGYFYNMFNSLKRKDIQSGLFSSNGLAGLLFFWILLYFVLTKLDIAKAILPDGLMVILLILLLAATLLKEPLANLVKKVRPLHQTAKSDYYIEESFGVVEFLLSLFSNTLSFIRVGAFAINHVGLFLAFETLSHMMSSEVMGIFMIVLGNVIIIGLEGLIVFIQGLRLEYYELFSKFYDGSGYEFEPVHIRAINGKTIH